MYYSSIEDPLGSFRNLSYTPYLLCSYFTCLNIVMFNWHVQSLSANFSIFVTSVSIPVNWFFFSLLKMNHIALSLFLVSLFWVDEWVRILHFLMVHAFVWLFEMLSFCFVNSCLWISFIFLKAAFEFYSDDSRATSTLGLNMPIAKVRLLRILPHNQCD